MPLLLDGLVHARSWAVYRLMWLDLAGHHYRLPIDTPKPLLVLRAGLLGEVGYFVAGAALFALLAVALRRASRGLCGRGWPGLVAFALVFAGNRYVLPGPFLIAYWPVVYYTLVVAAGWLFLEARYGAAFAVVGVSGLLRPESWPLAVLMLAWVRWREPDRFRWGHAGSLAAAPAWMAFDWALSGDPLYSFHTLQRYRAHLGIEPTGPSEYWGKVVGDAASHFHPALLAAGALALVVAVATARTGRRRRGHLFFLAVVAVPALGYWATALFSDVVLHVRFLSPALVALYFYAALLPFVLLSSLRGAGPGPGAAGEPRPGSFVGHRGRRWAGPRAGLAGARTGLAVAWAAVALVLGSRMDGWEKTRRVSRSRAVKQEARRHTAALLRRQWVDGGGHLLAGRSIEWLGLELGEEPSRRMHQYRIVARDSALLRSLGRGHAVWIDGDAGGCGARFAFLGRWRTSFHAGLLFRPLEALRGRGGRRLGIVHRFEALDTDLPPPAEP